MIPVSVYGNITSQFCHMMFKNLFYFHKLWFKLLTFASYVICRKFSTEVYIGLIRDGRETAVKKVMHSSYKLVKAEVKTLVKLRHHPNIVDYMVNKIY